MVSYSMKALILSAGFLIGLLVGLFPSPERPRPKWWQITVFLFFSVMIAVALLPPLGGSFSDAVLMSRVTGNKIVPVKATLLPETLVRDEQAGTWTMQMRDFSEPNIRATVIFPFEPPHDAKVAVVRMYRAESDVMFRATSVLSTDPLFTLPFIPDLNERARNIYFHVPLSWVAVLAYLIAMIYSIQYLRKNDHAYDVKAVSAASIGTLFTFLATVTGAIWAEFNWGTFWNWDPRETSIFILLLIYGAYFALRSAVENEDKRARLAAVYAIFAFVSVPFLVYIMPRIMEGLHPGSGSDVNAGPIVSAQPDALNPIKQIIFSLSFCSFTMVFFWMLSLRIRTGLLEYRMARQE